VAEYVLSLAGQEHDPDGAERGKTQYNTFCVACHLSDGGGNPALGYPNLNNDRWLYGSSRDEIAFTVRNGRNGNMPAHAELLGPEKSRIVAGYVATLGAR
jgi:cytochrome c oxidase cbb3-type subunit 3